MLKMICCHFLCAIPSLFLNASTQEEPDPKQVYGIWYTKELGSLSEDKPLKITQSPKAISTEDLKNLKEYIQDTQFSGVVYLSDQKGIYKVCSEKFETVEEDKLAFAIHSISKLYTGILTLIMLQDGIITKNTLLSPLELDDSVMQALPLSVRQRIGVTTLYDAMIHRGGFGDYLGKYITAIQKALENNTLPPLPYKPEDFLPFSDEKVWKLEEGETRYSNLGILLVGLSIQRHYQKIESLGYNEILKKHLFDKAQIPSFFYSKPDHGYFNENDTIAKHLCGSPAGGHWTTVKDLHKFGEWVKNKCLQDPDFMNLVEQYGQEFYSAANREIMHAGGIPSSSAFLSVFLDNGISIAIASDQGNRGMLGSFHLYNAIVRNLLAL